MRQSTPARTAVIADAAIDLVAREGMRALTHRAVDRAAGLPLGSTSYYARTRLALLELALDRMVELEAAAPSSDGIPDSLDRFVDGIVAFLWRSLTSGRNRSLARFEFALEATRRPELRAVYDQAGRPVRELCVAMFAAAGSPEPQRHARSLIAWCEGVVFDSLAGAGAARPPTRAELSAGVGEQLRVMLPRAS